MKVLITGGAGFIASQIQDAYINDGHEVVVVDNLSSGKRENVNPKAKFYEMDICDPSVIGVFEKERPQVLNHHAAQIDVRRSVADPKHDLHVNLAGFINLLEAGRKAGLEKVVLASSGGAIYGEQEFYPATEKHPARPISPYGLNKLGSEQYLHFYNNAYGLKWVALRYANVYGPRQNAEGEAGVVAVFLNKMLAGETPIINGDGKQTRDYVYVGDIVEANRIALRDDPHGPYNIGTEVETDVNAIFHSLRKASRCDCKEVHGPAKAGEQMRSCISSAWIGSQFGWRPRTSLNDGMRLTVEWFKKSVSRERTNAKAC